MIRFENDSRGEIGVRKICDKGTGVMYIFNTAGNAGGMTPLLESDGKPVVFIDQEQK